ncbi:unnamed protein product, partial [Owenia fusiformis]
MLVFQKRDSELNTSGSETSTSNDIAESTTDEPESTRGLWSRRVEFLLSALGYAVGLANIWRFPYLVYRNGGGAFFIPYFFFVLCAGIPLVFMEVAFGQYASLGPLTIWRVAPLFKGIGYGMVAISFLVSIYYNVLISWTLFYLFASMSNPLPWTTCDNFWNTPACLLNKYNRFNCSSLNGTLHFDNGTCLNVTDPLAPSQILGVELNLTNSNITKFESPTEEYFHHYVLQITDGLENIGTVRWHLALALLGSWIIVIFTLINGIRSAGKVVYVTATLPYLLLTVLFINAVLLPGASAGIRYYLMPDWKKLASGHVWGDAANQVLFSLGPCFGGLITLSSYNKFNANCYRDTIFISLLNCFTSVFAGLVIFATLGYMAELSGVKVGDVLIGGSGLAFEVYPAAVAEMPVPQLWSVLFFIMLLLVGIDSQFILVETVITAIIDEAPAYLQKKRIFVILGVCILGFLSGLPLITQGGIYVVQIMDLYVTGISLFILGFFETIALAWVYGFNRFANDIATMTGDRPGLWWKYCWRFITPLITLFVVVFALIDYIMDQDPHWTIGTSYEWPAWTQILGFCLALVSIIWVPLWAIVAIVHTPGSLRQRLHAVTSPLADWGPIFDSQPTKDEVPDYIGCMSPEEEAQLEQERKAAEASLSVSMSEEQIYSEFKGYQMRKSALYFAEEIDTGSIDWETDENKDRGNWSGRYDFLLTSLGYSVGLGNVWRFPYLVYRNGGGAFFIPYILMLVLCGIPLFYMELCFGQFASLGPISIWKVSPLFKGIGYGSCLLTVSVVIYYTMLIAWSMFYLFASMTNTLPWGSCDNIWNTPACREVSKMLSQLNCSDSTNITLTTAQTTTELVSPALMNATELVGNNETTGCLNNDTWKSASEEYFYYNVLERSDGIDTMGTVRWHLALCLLASWILIFCANIKGIKSVGKVVYVTVVAPYIILLVFLIRGLTLPGALDGIRYYVTPQWQRLADAQVWNDAATQIFFSISISYGGLIALSSYNRFHYNVYRDAMIVTLTDSATCVFAGFAVFSILGVMSHYTGRPIEDITSSGVGMAFVVYPEAVSLLPIPTLWAILFFLMLIVLGLDSAFIFVETLTTGILDEFSEKLRKKRIWVVGVVCAILFLLGLPLTTQGGIYLLQLMDEYASRWSALAIGLCECIVIAWVYGLEAFTFNVKAMLGEAPGPWWKIMWKFVSPVIIVFILVFSIVGYTPTKYDGYIYPWWAECVGFIIALVPFMCVPVFAIVALAQTRGHCSNATLDVVKPRFEYSTDNPDIITITTNQSSSDQRREEDAQEDISLEWQRMKLKDVVRPSRDWGPALRKHQLIGNFTVANNLDTLSTASSIMMNTSAMRSQQNKPDTIPRNMSKSSLKKQRLPRVSESEGSSVELPRRTSVCFSAETSTGANKMGPSGPALPKAHVCKHKTRRQEKRISRSTQTLLSDITIKDSQNNDIDSEQSDKDMNESTQGENPTAVCEVDIAQSDGQAVKNDNIGGVIDKSANKEAFVNQGFDFGEEQNKDIQSTINERDINENESAQSDLVQAQMPDEDLGTRNLVKKDQSACNNEADPEKIKHNYESSNASIVQHGGELLKRYGTPGLSAKSPEVHSNTPEVYYNTPVHSK